MTARDPQALSHLARALSPATQRVATAVAAVHRRAAGASAVRSVPRLSLWVAILAFAWAFLGALPVWLPAAALLVLVGLAFGVALGRSRAPQPVLADGALACDRANGNQDRLAAACELAGAAPGAEGQAEALARLAIDDGVQSLSRIDAARLALPHANGVLPWRRAVLCAAALALLPLVLPVPGGERPGHPTGADGKRAAAPTGEPARREEAAADRTNNAIEAPKRADERSDRKDPGNKAGTPPPPPKPAAPAPAVPAASGLGQSGSDATGDSSQSGAPKAAPAGNPGSGQSGGGQGSAASGAPEPSPQQQQQPKAPPKPKKPQPAKNDPQQDGKPSESAGAPSGPSRGSGRLSAVGNKRNDANRGQEREDDPEVEDEPVEDETDEQEQRGGVMPMRRGDNRPAARELSISGDGPPDQGRGGPTPPKKARGTASLVLGLRLPDSVRGQPNPGTAKTTLEQIPPRPSAAEPGLARAAEAGRPTTPQSQRSPTPLLSLQQAYHALLRARDGATIPPPVNQDRPPAVSPKDPR